MTDPKLQPLPRVTPQQLLMRGFKGVCPNCGNAKLFQSALKMEHRCAACGMLLKRGDGYYLGPLCLNYGFAVFAFVAPGLLLGFSDYIHLRLALVIALLGTFLMPILLYRFSWACWLTIYYICLPEELHANRPDDCDDLSFEEDLRSSV